MLKAGVKTSEFLAVLVFAIGTLASSLADKLTPKWAAISTAIAVGAYAVSRGLTKLGANMAVPPPVSSLPSPPTPPAASTPPQ